MIFGETYKQRHERAQAKLAALYDRWFLWFAWSPVRLDDSRVAWLQNVERQACIYQTYGVYGCDYPNDWRYRLPK